MAEMWKADDDTTKLMSDIVIEFHPDLVEFIEQIALIFREKAAKRGGQVVLGKASKASPLFGVLGDVDYKFIIELPADEWEGLTAKQKRACLDHHLCGCRADHDEETGETKFYIAPYEIAFYYDEYDRHGDWRPRSEREPADAPNEDQTGAGLDDMFGAGDPAEA